MYGILSKVPQYHKSFDLFASKKHNIYIHKICRILVSKYEMTCIMFCPNNDELIISSKKSGSLVCFYLKKQIKNIKLNDNIVPIYDITYQTDYDIKNNHVYPIKSIVFVKQTNGIQNNDIFELLTLDETGLIKLWKLRTFYDNNNIYNKQDLLLNQIKFDVGMVNSNNNHVNLSFLSNLNISHLDDEKDDYIINNKYKSLICCKSDNSFLIGYNNKVYLVQKIDTEFNIDKIYNFNKYNIMGIHHKNIYVTCISQSHLDKDIFLVGYNNGYICLYNKNIYNPIKTWYIVRYSHPIISLQWCPINPNIFYSIYDSTKSMFHIWDINSKDSVTHIYYIYIQNILYYIYVNPLQLIFIILNK